MQKQLLRYWLAMNATAFDSGARALYYFCGIAGAHEVSASIPAINLQQLACIFFIAFGRAILAYLDAHPLSGIQIEIENSHETSHPDNDAGHGGVSTNQPVLPGA
jgi:hypothetical protein